MRVPFFSTWLPSRGGLAIEFLVRGSCCFVRGQGKSRGDPCCVAKGTEAKRPGRGSLVLKPGRSSRAALKVSVLL